MNLAEEVGKRRVDYDQWMRKEEPRGFRAGTKDFRRNVTVVRERAGVMAAEADRERLGDEEFDRRLQERRARFGGGNASAAKPAATSAAAAAASTTEQRKDSGVVSGGEEESEDEVMVVGTAPPKEMSFTMKELDKVLAKGKGTKDMRAWVGRGTPPTRQQMIDWLTSVDEKELARRLREDEEEIVAAAEAAEAREARNSGRRVEREDKRKGKGKGKGSSSRREEEAEREHVRRREDGRSK